MLNGKKQKLIAVLAVQTLIIITIVIYNLLIISSGTTVYLPIEPIDPRDPLRGDYVTFSYNISRLEDYQLNQLYRQAPLADLADREIKVGDTVYVKLIKSGKTWSADYYGHVIGNSLPPEHKNGGVYIKGTITHVSPKNDRYDTVRILYGVEEYFIPEGTGRTNDLWTKEMVAEVALDENGNAVLKQIYADGKPWPE